MTRTLGDITNELKEKVLSPAKEEAERMLAEARLEADRIILDAKSQAVSTRLRTGHSEAEGGVEAGYVHRLRREHAAVLVETIVGQPHDSVVDTGRAVDAERSGGGRSHGERLAGGRRWLGRNRGAWIGPEQNGYDTQQQARNHLFDLL